MGVHNKDAYPHVKSLLGIPANEPIFILRAQDELAVESVGYYIDQATHAGCSEEFVAGVESVHSEFMAWGINNDTKTPD